jgi:hydroxypyruvate isomerase
VTIRFAANQSLLFTELPLMERFRAAREAGFDGVEILFPYDAPAQDMRDQLVWNDLAFVLMNGPPPNFAGGPAGYAALPGGEGRFRRDFGRVLRYARVLKPRVIHLMAGEAEGQAAHDAFVANLRWAAAEAPGQTLTIEPLNGADFPGYFLNSYALAADILAEAGAPNLRLQFDTYHAEAITGDAMGAWARWGGLAAHVQAGGWPGRVEPDRGRLDFAAFLRAVRDAGYDGWISGEYRPKAGTAAGLGWLAAAREA